MLTGLSGKVMTYDGENRPVTVTFAGQTTTYVYAADGTRLKKTVGSETTVYAGAVEIRKFAATDEEVIRYPHDDVREVNGVKSFLHRDHLASIRFFTNAAGNPHPGPRDAASGRADR